MERKILNDYAFRFYTYYGFSGRNNSKHYDLKKIPEDKYFNHYYDCLEMDNFIIFNITIYKAETIAKKLRKYTIVRRK